jgi:glyoxylase-like metal-dependent hydrolase (beta-lactamase superfamily II)
MLELRPLDDPAQAPALVAISANLFRYRDTCDVYVLRHGREAVLIDFGSGAVLDELEAVDIDRVTDVLVTHHHRDQVQGLSRAVDAGIRVWVPETERGLFDDVEAHWQGRALANSYNNRQDRFSLLEPIQVSGSLPDYAEIPFGGRPVRVLPTPGHTVGSVTFLFEIDGRRVACSGDLIAGTGKIWSLAATQWSYNGAEGVAATILSLLDLRERGIELLLPSHGEPIEEPTAAIDCLVERLLRLLELRREQADLLDRRRQPYEAITPHLLRNRTSFGASYVLCSESGRALVIDYGYDFSTGLAAGADRAGRRPWLYTIPHLLKDHGITAIDAVLPTHYHDDHVAGFNLLRRVQGAEVWTAETFADVLERPERYDLPCLWFEPIAVDRRLPLGVPIRWQEYEITLHDQPGHTRYAVAIEFVVDGERVLVVGDQVGDHDGQGLNYVYNNGFQIDDYARSAALYQAVKPDRILTGHWHPLRVDDLRLAEITRRGQALEAVHRELLPLRDLDLESSGPLLTLQPYRSEVCAGRAFEMTAKVRNPAARPERVAVRLVTPAGWPVEPVESSMVLRPGGSASFRFRLAAPAMTNARRVRVAAELSVGSRRLGQVAEALVSVRAGDAGR